MTASHDAIDVPLPEVKASTLYLYSIVLVAAVGGFLFGYDLSLISGAIIFLKTEFALSPFWFGAVAGSAILGCPFGPLAGVWLSDALGRKRTLILSSFLFLLSAIGSALALGVMDFSLWRFVGGMGVGLASTVSPMYIAEVAPAHLRGRLGYFFCPKARVGWRWWANMPRPCACCERSTAKRKRNVNYWKSATNWVSRRAGLANYFARGFAWPC